MWTTLNDEERLAKFSINEVEGPPIKHYCKPLLVMEDEITHAWPTCNPFREYCNGGGNVKNEVWICPHESGRHDVDFGNLSFRDWYSIRFGDAIIYLALFRNLELKYEKHILRGKTIKPLDDIPSEDDNDEGIQNRWCEQIKTSNGNV